MYSSAASTGFIRCSLPLSAAIWRTVAISCRRAMTRVDVVGVGLPDRAHRLDGERGQLRPRGLPVAVLGHLSSQAGPVTVAPAAPPAAATAAATAA